MHINQTILVMGVFLSLARVSFSQQGDIVPFLNDNLRIVLSAPSGPINAAGIDIQSESGSLVPAPSTDASPFTFFLSNTPTQITYGNLGSTVTIDGNLTLSAGWDQTGLPDIMVWYGDGATPAGPFEISADRYFGDCLDCVPVNVSLNEEQQVVIRGAGQSLTNFALSSASGSLIPGSNASPFASVEGTPQRVSYQAADLGSAVIDGSFTLDTRWAFGQPGARRDVEVSFNSVEAENTFNYPLNQNAYPERLPLDVSINNDNHLVVRGRNHPVSNLTFTSSSLALIPGDDPAPFSSVDGSARVVSYDADDATVILDGEITLGTRWAFGEPNKRADIRYSYRLQEDTFFNRETGIIPSSAYPQETAWNLIDVALNEADRFVITGEGQPLKRFDLRSNSGSLIPAADVGPFEQLVTNNENFVSYASDSNVVLDGSVTLATGWDRERQKDVTVQYDLDEVSNDPFLSLPRATYPDVPDPLVCFDGRAAGTSFFIDQRNNLVVRSDSEVSEIVFASESGSLVPDDDPSPFEMFESNTSELVHFASDGLVSLNGQVVLSTKWDSESEVRDITVDFGTQQPSDSIYPTCSDPIAGGGGGNDDFISGPAFGGGEGIAFIDENGFIIISGNLNAAGIDIISRTGELEPREGDAGPFTFFLSNTDNQVTFGNLGSTVAFDGLWNTGVRYVGDSPSADLQVFWGDGPTPISFPIVDGNPLIPEPSSSGLLFCGLLFCFGFRRTCHRRARRS